MKRIDIDAAIRQHTQWRRQFLNAFAGGAYADMPLSEHRSCLLERTLGGIQPDTASDLEIVARLQRADRRFHQLANEIIDLSSNGLSCDADLLLPELTDASHQLVSELDRLRESRTTI
ncbi:CZB domain-containing protein [Dechloromonas sp. ZY10]|uniref:CZB domain-containing protein n=1 Tax=Dechloromonas aquae TaxID=2664436 RepID=UPI00352793E1